ncbi:LysR family transcriptional regulator [Aquincola sp. S2]|uniref:LysR family transcriptional regulator n=1 Tax=Pseudaquabacterium terrae TaxID=2732868 RepID=A0ABX2ELE7_9BURK|nr:LysR family transcriptional regulator [Aquabacterium terrae]NRF69471.1 LysR family transcriptional regulator [Aquabacterium terrae]
MVKTSDLAAAKSGPELAALRLALRVADLGGVAAAARELNQLPATATAAVRRLEAQLGVRLFTRSSRALRPTPEGAAFLARSREALALLELAMGELHAPLTQVRGTLRLSVSADFGTHVLRPLLDEFLQAHPQLQLELFVSDRISDLAREPIDAALRYGVPEHAGQIVRHLVDNRAILVAAPAYLQRAGTPRRIEDLAQHEGIDLRIASRSGQRWRLLERGRPVEVKLRARRSVDNGLIARLWAIDGMGIALKAQLDVAADLAAGRLVRVLPKLQSPPYPLQLVLARGTHLNARMRALGDFLQPRLARLLDGG